MFALRRRIELFANLPFDELSRLALQKRVREIGGEIAHADRPDTAAPSPKALGTAGLLAAVVGSGIMGERLAGGNVAIALLANSLATGGALLALISTLRPISGAHLNPW